MGEVGTPTLNNPSGTDAAKNAKENVT